MDNDGTLNIKVVSSDNKIAQARSPPNLILPIPYGPIMAGESGSGFDDCEEDSLESLSNMFQMEHLSECANSNLFDYPMTGVVHGAGNRLVIPLKVRANLPKSKCFIVYFVVDSGAPLTSFSEKTVQKLCGKKVLQDVFIQDKLVNCRMSKACSKKLENVNLLGSQFLLSSHISIIFSPHEFDYFSDKRRIFYLTPFSMINQVQRMAAYPEQDPNINRKFECWTRGPGLGKALAFSHQRRDRPQLEPKPKRNLASSDPTDCKEKIEKAFPPMKTHNDSSAPISLDPTPPMSLDPSS